MPLTPIHDYLKIHKHITLDHYMRLCLQSNETGYYRTAKPIGAEGDFITAPEISQIFGELIGVFITFHQKMLFKNDYQICELGAGKGTLAKDYLRVLNKSIPPKDIFFLETNTYFKQQQHHNIPDGKHIDTLEDLPQKPTLFLANEFFDALPIKAFKVFGAEQAEYIIRLDQNNQLIFDYAEPTKNMSSQTHGTYETSEDIINFCRQISNHIHKFQGTFLLCDYGYDTPLKKTSFRGFYKHQVTDGLQRPCNEDLTADVNFKIIMDYFISQNLCVSNLCPQGDFLKGLHIETRLHKLLGTTSQKEARAHLIEGVQKLISSTEMGQRFKFLSISQINTPLYPFTHLI